MHNCLTSWIPHISYICGNYPALICEREVECAALWLLSWRAALSTSLPRVTFWVHGEISKIVVGVRQPQHKIK